MRRIAHLSDVHILDARAGTRRARYRFATKLVSLGRQIDPTARSRRLVRALAVAKASGADHFVISGDLTEVGEESEFEHFAEVLHDARLPEDSVTLVPGNHDAYTSADGWTKAMRGPLARFAAASAGGNGKVVDRGPVAFLPIDSTRFQTIAWSGGVFSRETARTMSRVIEDPGLRDKALVLVLHHPPFYPQAASAMVRRIDGLRGCAEVLDLLAKEPRLQLLHGHLHRVVDRILAGSSAVGLNLRPHHEALGSSPIRVFGAPATCNDSDAKPPQIRLYDVIAGALHPVATVAAA